MTDLTTSPYTCDSMQGDSYRISCRREAVAAHRSDWWSDGARVEGWHLLCKSHAAGMKRRKYASAEVVDLNPDIREAVDEHMAEEDERAAAKRVKSNIEAEKRHEARVQRECAEAAIEWVATLVIEGRPHYVSLEAGIVEESTATVVIHPAESGPDDSWNTIRIVLDVDDDPSIPASVLFHAGSPTTLHPSALAEVVALLPVVGEWAEEMNAA